MSTQPEQLEEPCPLGPGEVLSHRYSIELFIGEGSFGWVFSALDLSHSLRRVALKVLRQQYSAQEDMLRRFEERELALLLRVQEIQPTPYVVRALESRVQRHGVLSYLVLDFIDGPSLRDMLDRGSAPQPEQIRSLGLDLARGLAAIHAAGGVHRDLKPANIRLRGGQEPVIVDFGTALTLWAPRELTATGRAPMTPRYASPEQLAGRESTAASDVYAWGVILYEMLTGAVPSDTGGRMLQDVPGGFSWRKGRRELLNAVLRCLEYAPERRPTASELVEILSASTGPRRHLSGPQWALGLLTLFLMLMGGSHVFRSSSAPPISTPSSTLSPPPLHVPTSGTAQKPSPWSHRYGDAETQGNLSVVRDHQGNLFLAGVFEGSVDLGAGTLTSAGGEDFFVARLDPDGTVRWSQRFGDIGDQRAMSLAMDPMGELLVFGDFEETLDWGLLHHVSPRGYKLFLARFDAEGRQLWSRHWGEGDLMTATAMEVASDGTITLFGDFVGSIDFGCGTLVSEGNPDIFLARLSPNGVCHWSQRFGGKDVQGSGALTLDAAGNIAVWGYFTGTLDFGGNALINKGALWDSYIAVFDPQGHLSWSKRLYIPGSQGAPPLKEKYAPPIWALKFDPEGELVFLGDITIPAHTGTDVASASPSSGVHLARFAANGQILWSRRLGDSMSMNSGQIAVTAEGRLLLAGSARGIVDLGDGPFAGSGGPGSDLFVLELGRQGEFISARRFRGTAPLYISSVEEGPAGHPIVSGTFEGSLELGSGLLSTSGNRDLFIAQLAPVARESPFPKNPVCIQPPPGLSAWYPLDAPDVGAAMGDTRAGKAFHGAHLVEGREHGVLGLESGFFQAPAHEALDVGRGDFSLSLWMRTNDTRDVSALLDKRIQVPPGVGPSTGYFLFVDRGRLVFQLADGLGSSNCGRLGSCTNYVSGHFVADGAWHLVTVTVERQAPEGGTFYVDGAEVARFSARSGSLDNPGPLRLGSRSFEGTGLFEGLIDDVALWKRALSADEVARLYGAGSAGMCQGVRIITP